MAAEREFVQAWHECEVELKQLRVLLRIREKQIEDLKQYIRTKKRETEKTIIYNNTIGDFDLLCAHCQRYLKTL